MGEYFFHVFSWPTRLVIPAATVNELRFQSPLSRTWRWTRLRSYPSMLNCIPTLTFASRSTPVVLSEVGI